MVPAVHSHQTLLNDQSIDMVTSRTLSRCSDNFVSLCCYSMVFTKTGWRWKSPVVECLAEQLPRRLTEARLRFQGKSSMATSLCQGCYPSSGRSPSPPFTAMNCSQIGRRSVRKFFCNISSLMRPCYLPNLIKQSPRLVLRKTDGTVTNQE